MDVIMKYYNVNRIFLLGIGLWPYQKSVYNKIFTVCLFVLFAQFLTFQLMIFITADFSILLLLEVLTTLLIGFSSALKYCSIYFIIDKIKLFLESIKYDWDTLQDLVEIKIMKRQANIARWYTKYFALAMYIPTSLFILMHYLPLVLDAVQPLAEPRPRKVWIVGEMFIDQHKYFHIILLNIMVLCFVGMTIVIATETFLMVLIQHVCGLLKVTSYRITHAFDNNCFPSFSRSKKCTVCSKLASAVKIHRSAIMFSDGIKHYLEVSYFILIFIGVASISINLYRLILALTVINKMDAIIIFALLNGNFLYMFWCNYAGQELINYNAGVYRQTYNTQWYTSPVHNQKMLILILRRCAKPPVFGFSNVFVGSFEGFGTLLSMALSYFTVLYSLR